ncbi:hypothetical protein HPB48_007854 [Haemaphysalis longicornis]|uniref:Uncharacterized protein n=1 Tax=Haemaphysalis longicornis TaxID=44386 RepID=A0A9J6GIJ8_HAELO|nr:hypothetical protein HPB48_007854 [Haemaphysalis longicornis]
MTGKTKPLHPSLRADWGAHFTLDKPLANQNPQLLLETFPELANMNPFELFSKIISPEYLGLMADMTATYALQKKTKVLVTSYQHRRGECAV